MDRYRQEVSNPFLQSIFLVLSPFNVPKLNSVDMNIFASELSGSSFPLTSVLSGDSLSSAPLDPRASPPSVMLSPGDLLSGEFIRGAKTSLKLKIRGKGDRIVGTAENDTLDASKGKGRNTLLGKKGNDRLLGKKRDKLIGGPGNDRLDTRKGSKNTLKGGGGNDTFFVGKKDTASGGGGSDTLNALKGRGQNTLKGGGGDDTLIGKMGDRLIGGGGADDFVLVKGKLPKQPLVVQDFQQGSDRLVIQNFSGVSVFNDLEFTQQNKDTLLSIQGQSVAILQNVTATQLTSSDIEGVASSPELSISDASVFEGNPGDNTSLAFIVRLNQPTNRTVTVAYKTANIANGAIANVDYTLTQGILTIPAGSTSRLIEVPVIEDLDDENNEAFQVKLTNISGADLKDGTAVGIIRDDEDETVSSRRSNGYSTTGTDETSILYQYEMTDSTANGEAIGDEFPIDVNTGLFLGAILNLQSGSGTLTSLAAETFFEFSPNGNTSFAIGNLKAEFNPLTEVLKYSITPSGSTDPTLTFSTNINAFPTASGDPVNANLAVNSLPYIINENLINRGFLDTDIPEFFFGDVGNYRTRKISEYVKERRDRFGNVQTILELIAVDRTEPDFDDGSVGSDFIEDDNLSASSGYFIGAIETFLNVGTGQSFAQGNLRAERGGSSVTYTLESSSSSILVSNSVNLSGTGLDVDKATNNLDYILDNDLLKRSFFD